MSDHESVPDPDEQPAPDPSGVKDDAAQVRELILASHTDIVPELVQGDSVSDLVASIDHARQAYSRIVESQPKPVTIPAGGNTPVTIDINTLPTSEKLRRGLAAYRKDQ